MSSFFNETNAVVGTIVGLGVIIGAVFKFHLFQRIGRGLSWLKAHRPASAKEVAALRARIELLEEQRQEYLIGSGQSHTDISNLEARLNGVDKALQSQHNHTGILEVIVSSLEEQLTEHTNAAVHIRPGPYDEPGQIAEMRRMLTESPPTHRNPLKDPPKF